MVIDSSAIIAILRGELDANALERRLVAAPVRLIPATCYSTLPLYSPIMDSLSKLT
jgi:uncharacterized protein with PIN domain